MHLSKYIWICVVIAALMGVVGFRVYRNQAPPTVSDSPIVYFDYSHNGSISYDIYSYEVIRNEETGEMTVNYSLNCGYETYTLPADAEMMQALAELIDNHSLQKWDGFSETNSWVLDGSGFSLNVRFEDGDGITASGSNSFPNGYSDASSAIDELFQHYLKENGITPEGGY